jgi:hypothetical protein
MYCQPVETLESDLKAFAYVGSVYASSDRAIGVLGGKVLIECLRKREIFSFTSPEMKLDVIFDVRGIKDALAAKKLAFTMFEGELSQEWHDSVIRSNGVEAERVAQLTAEDLERPGIVIGWGGPAQGEHTLIDGNHRMARRWQLGMKTFRFAVVPMSKKLLRRYICSPGEQMRFIEREIRKESMK